MHIRPSKLLWMLLSVAILGCRDSIGPSVRMPSNAAPGVNIIARLDCSAEIRTNIVTCAAARPERSANGPSLGLLGTGQIKVRSFNVSSDTINGILQADVDVANLLPEVVGTLDGTTVTGIKVFHHSGPTVTKYFNVGDTGRVVVHNAEGYRFFTNPNQPYFQYDTILATNDTSAAKLWQWKYSRTVSNFAFTLMVEANLPSEARVPGYPPDTVPDWVYADSNAISGGSHITGLISKDVVMVLFKPVTTQPLRRAAIDSIGGTVIGGQRLSNGDGFYFVRVPGDGTAGPAVRAVNKLNSLPQVEAAIEVFLDTYSMLSSVRPNDGNDFRNWRLRVDSADGRNWGPEAVAAPFAWGCSRGDSLAAVAIVDHDFHGVTDITANRDTAVGSAVLNQFSTGTDTDDHATIVSSIVGARGDNGTGITGMMWGARMRLYDVGVDAAGNTKTINGKRVFVGLEDRLVQAGLDGAGVINLSVGLDWDLLVSPGYSPHTHGDSVRAARVGNLMSSVIRTLEGQPTPRRPLFVIAASNNHIDAYWGGFPQANSSHPNRVLVVGAASNTAGGGSSFSLASFSNRGALVDMVAPGENVYALKAGGTPVAVNGTSFAAPFVTGTVGLLLAFDPRLTADTLHQLIMDGAKKGGRQAGGFYMLNAHESLRLAAARRTAPLCGNPVYQDSLGRVFARRDTVWYNANDTQTSNNELLFTTADSLIDVQHGGKRVRFASTNGFEWQRAGSGASWVARTAMLDTITNASNRSKRALSHGHHQTPYTDSTVTVTKMRISPTQERFDVLLPSGTTVPISGPYAPAQQTGLEARPCVTWRVNDPTKQSCVEFAPDSYRDSVTTRHTVAFSPAGDYVVLAISRDSLAYDVGAVQGDGTYFHRPHGPHEETIGTLLWIIPVRGGANFGPIKVPERVEALGLSEEGRYLVLQTRNLFFKGTTTGASSGMTFTKHNICSAEFRRTGGAASLFSPTTSPPFNSTSPCVPGSTFSP